MNYSVAEAGQVQAPHNIEAEQALLGAILIDNRSYDRIGEDLKHEHFYDPLHGKIYAVMSSLLQTDRAVTPITLKTYFENEPPLGELTILQYLGRLASHAASIINVSDYAKTIKELFLRRKLLEIAYNISDLACNATPDYGVEKQIEEIEQDLYTLSQNKTSKFKNENLYESADRVLKNINNHDDIITTGLIDLDKMIGGYTKGQFVIKAGRTSMGKSAEALSAALKQAQAGFGVYLQSMEMTADEVSERCLSDLCFTSNSPIEYKRIRVKDLHQHEIERLHKAADELRLLPIKVDDQRGIGVAQIASKARRFNQEFQKVGKKLDVIIIDHLGHLKASSRYAGSKVNEIAEISDQICTLAKEMNVVVIALHQLNRAVENRDNKIPTLADLRDSGNLEQDAHIVMFNYRAAYYLERYKETDYEKENLRLAVLEAKKNDLEIIVAKNRNGRCGNVLVNAFMGSNAIRNRI